MDRPGRGFALLALLALVAGASVVVLREANEPSAAVPRVAQDVRLNPLPPYEKPPVPDGFRAETVKGLWRLERVEADSRTLVIRAASGGCWKFDFLSLDAADPEALHLSAWNEGWQSERENLFCTAELGIGSYRVRLPQPVSGRRIEGECVPGDSTPSERQCAALVSVTQRS